jgi:hypothetical protein
MRAVVVTLDRHPDHIIRCHDVGFHLFECAKVEAIHSSRMILNKLAVAAS